MNNDIYDDLTNEEKALIEHEVKDRIAFYKDLSNEDKANLEHAFKLTIRDRIVKENYPAKQSNALIRIGVVMMILSVILVFGLNLAPLNFILFITFVGGLIGTAMGIVMQLQQGYKSTHKKKR